MADLTPEVANALVRLMNGEIDYDDLDDRQLFALGKASRRGQMTLHEVVLKLRERGYNLKQIGEGMGASESAASRWADAPPNPPGRRRREGDPETQSAEFPQDRSS